MRREGIRDPWLLEEVLFLLWGSGVLVMYKLTAAKGPASCGHPRPYHSWSAYTTSILHGFYCQYVTTWYLMMHYAKPNHAYATPKYAKTLHRLIQYRSNHIETKCISTAIYGAKWWSMRMQVCSNHRSIPEGCNEETKRVTLNTINW